MPPGAVRKGVVGRTLALLSRLRAKCGKKFADFLVTLVVAAVAAGAALWLSTTLPLRFVENLTYDFRLAWGAPPPQREFVIVKMDEAMTEASECHCLAPIDKAWLGDLIASLDSKGVKAIAVDYLLDTWSSPEEFQDFEG